MKCELAVDSHGIRFTLPEGGVAEVFIKEGQNNEALQSIVLQSEKASFRLARDCGAAYVCTRVEINDHVIEGMLPADLPDESALIADQLSRLGGQSLYSQMVPMLQKMLSM